MSEEEELRQYISDEQSKPQRLQDARVRLQEIEHERKQAAQAAEDRKRWEADKRIRDSLIPGKQQLFMRIGKDFCPIDKWWSTPGHTFVASAANRDGKRGFSVVEGHVDPNFLMNYAPN